ncbi:MAG: cysteine desulfurase NifS, partial [Candidatus Nanopelagicales bacterium]
GAAAHAAAHGLDRRAELCRILREELWDALSASIPGITRHTPMHSLPNTLSVSFPGVLGAEVLRHAPAVAASTGSACHSGAEHPSAVLTAMGVGHAEAMGTVRLSLGHGTSARDVRQAARELREAFHATRS